MVAASVEMLQLTNLHCRLQATDKLPRLSGGIGVGRATLGGYDCGRDYHSNECQGYQQIMHDLSPVRGRGVPLDIPRIVHF